MGFVLPDLFRRQPSHSAKTVGFSAPMQFFKAWELTGIGRNDDFPAPFMSNTVLLAEAVHRLPSLHAITRFQRAGFVVKTRVNNAAVVSRLMGRKAVLRLEENQFHVRASRYQRVRRGESHNAPADDCNVVDQFSHTDGFYRTTASSACR